MKNEEEEKTANENSNDNNKKIRSDNKSNELKKKKISRRFRVLKDCLMLLKHNGVTLDLFILKLIN